MAKDTLKLYYSLSANTLPETAGYHAAVSHVGTVDAETFFARVAARRSGLDASTAELVLASVCSAAEEILTERQYRIALGDVAFELAIPGSTDSIDGTMPGSAYVAVRPSSAIRNAAVGITPVYSAGDGEKTEVFAVEDATSNKAGEISGTGLFRLTGVNISASGDGESLKVSAENGTEAVAEVTEDSGTGRFITAHLPVALPPGKGKVVLLTHGKRTPEGELHSCVKAVTIRAGETPPGPTPAFTFTGVSTSGGPMGLVNYSQSIQLHGTGLVEEATIEAKPTDSAGEFFAVPGGFMDFDSDELIRLDSEVQVGDMTLWDYLTQTVGISSQHNSVTFRITQDGESKTASATVNFE